MQVKKEERDNAEVSLTGVLSKKEVEAFWDKALNQAKKEVTIQGFRKGHAPDERVIQEVGENYLWKQAAEAALRDSLEDILKEENVVPITPLSLSLKEAEKDEDVEFEIIAVTPPTCEIGDYKKLAKDALDTLSKEDEAKQIEEAKKSFRMQIRAIAKMQKPDEVKEGDAKQNEEDAVKPISDEESKMVGMENGKAAEHFLEGEAKKAVKEKANQKKRGAIAEALIENAKCQIPKALVEDETRALIDVFKRDVVNQGMQWDDYLKKVKKNEAEITEDLRPNARKRIVLDLTFAEIVKKEDIKPAEEDKKKEDDVAHTLVKQGVDHQRAHAYAREQLIREKVWDLLGAKADVEA